MSSLDEFQWFVLFLLIMKVMLMWALSAWLIAVTADRPCSEYCVHLSSGMRNIELQTGCDCMIDESELQDEIDESSIYYEPVNYIPVPTYIHNQPFYILNPIIHGRPVHEPVNNPVIPESAESSLNVRKHNTDIEINIDNIDSSHNRQEKDIQTQKERLSTPFYLDISVESEEIEGSDSMNTFTVDELKIIERSLVECVDIYSALQSTKNTKTDVMDTANPNHSDEHNQLSNPEFRKLIEDKCSNLSNFIDKSLNEIKQSRPKLTSVYFKIGGEDQQNNDERVPNNMHPTNQTPCKSINAKKEYAENQDEAVVFFKQNISDTLSSEESSTAAASTSEGNMPFSLEFFTKPDISTEATRETIEQLPYQNEYEFHEKTVNLLPTTTTLEKSTPASLGNKAVLKQKIIENRDIDQEFRPSNVERHTENRSRYYEGEVPLTKIITQEFINNTVQSFINGTEDIPNGDFNDETSHNELGNENEGSNKNLPYYQYAESTTTEFEAIPPGTGDGVSSSDISGNLYFVFDNQRVPARFVQNLNGSLHLGIDGATLCNTLPENDERNSSLLKAVCTCYKSNNCTHN